MTLDPVHFDGINSLAEKIRADYDPDEDDELTDELWGYLDPLFSDGERLVYPIDQLGRKKVSIEEIALIDDEYPTQHGLDSGTLNARAFTNGLVLDLGHAAMASLPTDLELHRKRTVVSAVHSNDSRVLLDDDWVSFDDTYSKGRVVQVSKDLERHVRDAVHSYALYLSESEHLLDNLDEVEDLLFLDGPLYPMGVIRWIGRGEPVVKDSEHTEKVVENYSEAAEEMMNRDIPVVGFVKNMSSRRIVRTIRDKRNCPWPTDASFFKRVLQCDDEKDKLTFTNWFVSSFYGEDDFSIDFPELEHGREDYLVTFMVVYDPRSEVVYKTESPLYFTRDEETREKLTRQILKEVAVNKVPRSVGRADELARISRDEKDSLVESLEQRMRTREDLTYNDERWGVEKD